MYACLNDYSAPPAYDILSLSHPTTLSHSLVFSPHPIPTTPLSLLPPYHTLLTLPHLTHHHPYHPNPVLPGLHNYSARVRQRHALIQWSRASLAALYRRRRRIFLRYFGVLRGYSRHLRLTREGFIARILGFERRSTLLWVWTQFRKCSRDHIYTKLTHVLMDTLLKVRRRTK